MAPSWETIVTDVCVNGRPAWLGDAAAIWRTIFTNAQTVADALRDSSRQLEPLWTGPAGDDYRQHLESVAKRIEQIHQDNQAVVTMLEKSAGDLGTAQAKIPIPDHMLDEVYYKRAQLDSANGTYGGIGLVAGTVMMAPVALPMWTGVGAGAAFGGGQFWDSLVSGMGNVTRETLGWLWDKVDDHTKEAQQDYTDLTGQYSATIAQTPQPTGGTFVSPMSDYNPGLGGGGTGGGAGGVSGLHGAGAAPKLNTSPSGVDPFKSSDHKPGNELGTGLSGAGGPGGPTGLGTGGLGPTGLGSAGLDPGPGGARAGMAGVGRPVSLGGALAGVPAGGMPMAGAGGRGTGRGGAGRGAGRPGAGMMGTGAGHGAGGGGDERATWLVEDDDVWGTRTDVPPGVIGSGPDR